MEKLKNWRMETWRNEMMEENKQAFPSKYNYIDDLQANRLTNTT